MAWVLDEEMFL
jgi:hypothetical protein